MIKIAQFGYGYWGPNLARNFSQTKGCSLEWIIDANPKNLARAKERHPLTQTASSADQALSDTEVDAIVIATPAETHFELAAQGIAAGKHIFVEKPLCSNANEAANLVELANNAGVTLFVGHVFIYNAAVKEIQKTIQAGILGELYCIHSQRLSLGRVRNDVDVLWNLAPHDISILLHILGEYPVNIHGYGHSFLQEGINDVGFIDLKFPSGTSAHIHCSWLHPQKTREMVFVGSKKMLVYDDVSADAKIKIYDCGVDKKELPRGLPPMESFAHFQLQQRHGDITIPRIDFPEPLSVQSKAFVDSIITGCPPETDGQMGLEVVRILQQASPPIPR